MRVKVLVAVVLHMIGLVSNVFLFSLFVFLRHLAMLTCKFSLLLSIHFLEYKLGEFVKI